MLVIVLIGFLFIIFFYYKFLQIKNYWSKKGAPYINPLPIVGNMGPVLTMKQNFIDFVINIYNAYPTKRYVGFHQFHQPTLLIRDPELIKTIMVKEFTSFSDHSTFNRGICEAYEGLFFVPAHKGWHDIRTILSPFFTNSKLKYMFKLFEECGNEFVDYFKQQGSVPIDLKDSFSRYTNDTIFTTIFGVKCESFKNKKNLIFTTGEELTDMSGIIGFLKFFCYNISPFFTKLLNVQIVNPKTVNLFANIVDETLNIRKEINVVRPDMINIMLKTKAKGNYENSQNKRYLTNEDIKAAAISFYFAGTVTTSTCLTFVAYELGVNYDIQVKLRKEVDEVIDRCNGQLTYEEVMNMKYLEMIISETLRKWSPSPFVDRLCVKSFTIEPVNPDEKPVTIEAGTSIWLLGSGLHHDSKYYDNPDEFDPERFNEENKSKRHQFTYMPFGGGPRICIGSKYAILVCKIILIKIIQNFELIPCKTTPTHLKAESGVSIVPNEGVWVTFKPRLN